jgi:uncharacterized protein (TIGR03437 family)
VAGSDNAQPTAGGDLNLPAAGGSYAPSNTGSLLLARVNSAGPNGAGGSPVYLPQAIGTGTVFFSSVSELAVSGGSAYVVYEVVDSNSSRIESAQFPTFLGLPPDGSRVASETSSTVTLAAVSSIATASANEPLPRFLALTPPQDCVIVGDCSALLPELSVSPTRLDLTAAPPATQQSNFLIRNTAGGILSWSTSVSYASGSGWLTVRPASGLNNTTVQVFANPNNLAAGTYQATITVTAGADITPQTVAVNFMVPATGPAAPVITSVLNAADFSAGAVVPGSLSTIMGAGLSGTNPGATFNGMPATILYNDGQQINLQVPAALPTGTAQLLVTSNGVSSAPKNVNVASFAPAIFGHAAVNQNGSINSLTNPASASDVIMVFATGLSGTGQITARLGGQVISAPYYAGPAPGVTGVQQVNVQIPNVYPAGTVDLAVCGDAGQGQAPICSTAVPLTIH